MKYILDPILFKYQLNKLKKYVKEGNSLDSAHKIIFIQSIIDRKNDIVRRYLVCGMSPDTKVNGLSALKAAVTHRCYGIVKMLIIFGLNVTDKYEDDLTIVEYARNNTRNDEAMLILTIDRSLCKKPCC